MSGCSISILILSGNLGSELESSKEEHVTDDLCFR